ncbi:uncharacterized protein PRCAT00004016001 [Priceomyces carsonii]|uniref:uncharacterized protein n=1 Tax=Priceomyces carsonii TaxID=28549 RepID=UPI002ED79B4D|nr:unnamed protein product [Priceomyces carsonii]
MIDNECIKYGDNELQSIRIYKRAKWSSKSVIFIHGGAWRDPSNTFDDFKIVAASMIEDGFEGLIFSINYRLSPEFKHPIHLIDILSAISFLQERFNISEMQLIGHSVGASFILQLLSMSTIVEDGISDLALAQHGKNSQLPDATQLQILFDAVSKVKIGKLVLIDGIYDNEELLKEYGDLYRGFINDAFSSDKHYKNAFQLSNPKFNSVFSFEVIPDHIYILHSMDDELLSPKQTQLLLTFLKKTDLKYKVFFDHWGKHEEVYSNQKVAKLINSFL